MELRLFVCNSPEYKQALTLRDRILRKPLGLKFTAKELEKDIADMHFGLFDGERIVACLSLTKCEKGKMKMRQVAVDEAAQGKGYGKQLSLAAEAYARKQGAETIYCHARKVAVSFYQKLGYYITSDEFTEVTIPHYQMEKKLLKD